MVVVVVIAIVGDGRDIVAIGTESGVIGSIYNMTSIIIIVIIIIIIIMCNSYSSKRVRFNFFVIT